MLTLCKTALRISTSAFDTEIKMLINDCLLELYGLGLVDDATMDPVDEQIQGAVIFYCKWKFGDNPDAERWEHIYNDKISRLLLMSGYGLEE